MPTNLSIQSKETPNLSLLRFSFAALATTNSQQPSLFKPLVESSLYKELALSACRAYQNGAELFSDFQRDSTRTAQFLQGLKDCHVSALSVSALIGRILFIQDRPKELVLAAAKEMFLTIAEDTGATDTPHGILY